MQPLRRFVVVTFPKLWKIIICVRRELPPTSLTCFIRFCVGRCNKMDISRLFEWRDTYSFCWMNPLAGFGGWIARNYDETQLSYILAYGTHCTKIRISRFLNAPRCSETRIIILLDEPSLRWVDRAKLWRNFKIFELTLLQRDAHFHFAG